VGWLYGNPVRDDLCLFILSVNASHSDFGDSDYMSRSVSHSPTSPSPDQRVPLEHCTMLLWILVGFGILIVALASLSDHIWKERMNPPAQRHPVVCHYCTQRNSAVEVVGHWVHQFRGRWISCPAKNQQQTEAAEAPLAEAWQRDQLLPVAGQRG